MSDWHNPKDKKEQIRNPQEHINIILFLDANLENEMVNTFLNGIM